MTASTKVGRGESPREMLEPWRPKVLRMSEETKAAIAELESISTWADFVRVCQEQEAKRLKRGA